VTEDRVRIAYVINEMVVGGSQTHLRQVLRLLDRRRFDPALVCLSGRGVLLEDVRALRVPVYAPAEDAAFRGLGLAKRIARTSALLRRLQPDVVHAYLLRGNFVGAVSARLARVPVVLCSTRGCHELHGAELFAAKIANALADAVMVNAQAVRDFVHEHEGCPKDKMFVIPSGIDTERFRPLPAGDYKTRLGVPAGSIVVGTVTRQRIRKGVVEFLQAVSAVRSREERVHGVIVGEVSEQGELSEWLDRLGLTGHVTLAGRRSDMPEVLSAFDLYVLSSHDEGMSNALLEAMAMELPVVATDVGGTGEVVVPGESGFLVPPKDPKALAAGIEQVLSRPDRGRSMGRVGRTIVEQKFSARSMVRDMERVYLSWIQQRRSHRRGSRAAA
jgi:glycosyltransferase involved in cell wall biosynthesis